MSGPEGLARDAAGNLYVTNPPPSGNPGGTVTVYAPTANGNASPTRTVASDSTGLFGPVGVTADSAGTLYVANSASITVYAPNASGNASPIRTIAGSNTAPQATGDAPPLATLAGPNTGLTGPAYVAVGQPGALLGCREK